MSRHPSIFEFESPRDFLVALLAAKRRENRAFSVRGWAKRLGYRGPSVLLAVLSGARQVSPDLAERLAASLRLPAQERSYLRLLVLRARIDDPGERAVLDAQIAQERPDPRRRALSQTHFKLIAQWHALAVLEMPALRDFRPDPSYIARRLRAKISPEDARHALTLLQKLGLLNKATDGRVVRGEKNPALGAEIPSEAVRDHHRALLTRAREALREQALNQRDFRSTKLALKRESLEEAKRILRDAHRAVQRLAAQAGEADEIYALNTQLFMLTGGGAE